MFYQFQGVTLQKGLSKADLKGTLLHFAKTYFGEDRIISVSRELTKIYEETTRGTVLEVIEYYTTHIAKGEFVICIAGK